ncbi:MAG: tRNA (adenosine(37)-N6)-dimethylallyltransferase MiaA [Parcubacteria group bacterium]|nr:tRNA (adenosine(37)-N6)-dimethylallyltransferase MiaA [Parcubacteria group bacterium]MCR4342987.1 tRNA (adenosine(37)-N6)-dimethylallyltransferase MiaA [Patescibacteria group bacterium]
METKRRNKIIVILGPTAVGKSDFAVKIAGKINGEIISADSRQIYTSLNIGTGKIKSKEMKGIPHHLMSIISPRKAFSVVQYKKLADEVMQNILDKDKIPIIVGGTGLYIQSIVDNISIPEVPPNKTLRKKLETKTNEELFRILKKMDSRRAEAIDKNNPRRLIRAIEIAKMLGNVPEFKSSPDTNYQFLQIGLNLDNEKLKQRIEKRVKKMLKAGLLKEIKNVRQKGLSWKKLYEMGFEYKYPALFIRGKISKDEMLQKMLTANYKYAKRQMTWFKRDKRIKWLTAEEGRLRKSEKLINDFLL